jgi:peptidoglycan/LPS O-acetylase OafA/YrhL
MFFVISGYLMAIRHSDISGLQDMKRFYLSRLARVAPAYYVVLIAIATLSAMILLPFEYESGRRTTILNSLFMGNFSVWLQSGYFARQMFRPALHLWSLGVEVQFYLLFPFLAIALRKRRWRVALLISVSLFAYVAVLVVSPKSSFLMMPLRLWQFGLGYLAAILPVHPPPRLYIFGIAGAVLLLVLCPILRIGPLSGTVGVTFLTALAVFASSVAGAPKGLFEKIFAILGTYSYSIYLTHYPIIAFTSYKPFEGSFNRLQTPLDYLFVLVVTGIASFLLFHLVEAPPRRRLKKLSAAMAVIVAGSVSACVAAAAAPLVVQRHPAGREGLAASAWLDRLPERCPILGRILHPFEKSCLVKGTGSRVALLIGDSHTDVLKKILGDEIQRRGGTLRLLINHSGVYFPSAGRLAKIALHNRVDLFSVERLSPSDVIAEARRWKAEKIIFHARVDHVDVDALIALANMAKRNGMKLYVILPVPNPGFGVPEHLFQLAAHGRAPEKFMLSARNRLTEGDVLKLRNSESTNSSLRILDPWSYLCRPQCAMASTEGKPYFSDSQHLTQTGVEQLRPLLASIG